jgi:hypothetical protein
MDNEMPGRNRTVLEPENRWPWYQAYAGRSWLVVIAGSVVGLALLFVGVAFGGGNRAHVIPGGTPGGAVIGGSVTMG